MWSVRAVAILLSMFAIGCSAMGRFEEDRTPPPNAKAIILANMGRLYKDPDSLRNVSITEPKRHNAVAYQMWHVCVRANSKNSFGAYTGEKDTLIGIYDDDRPPEVLGEAGLVQAASCDLLPHAPFPEFEGKQR